MMRTASPGVAPAGVATPAGKRIVKVKGTAFVRGGDVLRGESVYLVTVNATELKPPQFLGRSDGRGEFAFDVETPAGVTAITIGMERHGAFTMDGAAWLTIAPDDPSEKVYTASLAAER